MFIDYAKIYVKAGQGGSGAVSFRREKHVPKGGPNGGDGGNGGSIIFEVDEQLRTLIDFRYKRHYTARHGQHGMGSNKTGRAAADILVKIPAGTVVKDAESGQVLADLVIPGEKFVAAKGGKGGWGNAHYVTATHQAPREWEVGEAGEERWLILELKIIADVGLVGKPNAGKSTLLSKLSAARPKIADYPFTTLQPNLGIVRLDLSKSFVIADIPGLIEGAHEGRGLGLQFLRHIERTRLLLFMIDPMEDDANETFKTLYEELESYSQALVKKPFLVIFNKKDAWTEDYLKKMRKEFAEPLIAISSLTGEGLDALKWEIWKKLGELSDDSTRYAAEEE